MIYGKGSGVSRGRRRAFFKLILKWVSRVFMLVLSRTKGAIPLNNIGAPKTSSDLTDANRLVLFISPQPAKRKIELAFLWAEILSMIWGVMEDASLTIPTWSAEGDRGIGILEIVIVVRADSMGGRWASLLWTNATSLVFSGSKIVLDLVAYDSLNWARDSGGLRPGQPGQLPWAPSHAITWRAPS